MVRRKNTPSSRTESKSPTGSSVSRESKKRKSVSGRALQEIKHFQNTTDFLIPRKSFQDVVRQTVLQIACRHRFTESLRFSKSSMEALQEAAESYMVNFFEDALLCTLHARRVTLMVRDLELTRHLRGPNEVCNR